MRPSTPRRERILAYGGPGSSKTRSWLAIAEFYRKTKTSGKFFHVDTDDAYWATVEEFPKLPDSGIVESKFVTEWSEYNSVVNEFKARITPDDWLVVDLFDKGWEEVQNYYCWETFGMSLADYFLAKRKEQETNKKKKSSNFQPLEGWVDWSVIKPMHAQWANNILYRHHGHVYLATGQKPLNRTTDKKEVVDTFGHLGSKPGGEKSIGVHGVHTVIKMSQKAIEEWVMDTGKDRGAREKMIKVENKNFATDYLLNPRRGGWKLK